jgi:hypothetical protein
MLVTELARAGAHAQRREGKLGILQMGIDGLKQSTLCSNGKLAFAAAHT